MLAGLAKQRTSVVEQELLSYYCSLFLNIENRIPELNIRRSVYISAMPQKYASRWKSRLDLPVSRFAQPPVTIFADDAVRDAAKLMCQKQVGSLIVAEKRGEPLGMLTEWDLVSRVIAAGKNVERTTAREVMSTPLIKVDASVKTGDALRIMTNRGIRRIAIYEDGVLEGVVAQNQIVGNRRSSSSLPMVEPVKGHLCAYCNLTFTTRNQLEKHINSIHAETLALEREAREKPYSQS